VTAALLPVLDLAVPDLAACDGAPELTVEFRGVFVGFQQAVVGTDQLFL
jgi:hypothetical protein